MPCHISDGPETPEDLDEIRADRDPDQGYDDERQRIHDQGSEHTYRRAADLANAEPAMRGGLHTRVGKYTGRTLYSYDQAYWWSTEATAWRIHQILRNEP